MAHRLRRSAYRTHNARIGRGDQFIGSLHQSQPGIAGRYLAACWIASLKGAMAMLAFDGPTLILDADLQAAAAHRTILRIISWHGHSAIYSEPEWGRRLTNNVFCRHPTPPRKNERQPLA